MAAGVTGKLRPKLPAERRTIRHYDARERPRKGNSREGTSADDTRGRGELMVNGNREMSNNFLLDGVDKKFRRNALITVRPTVESIQEFKMQTNLFGAEQGRNSEATVNAVTKSGSNIFHGSIFEFLRNDALDARNFLNAASNNAKPPYRQNQFGGASAAQSSAISYSSSAIMRAFEKPRAPIPQSTRFQPQHSGLGISARPGRSTIRRP